VTKLFVYISLYLFVRFASIRLNLWHLEKSIRLSSSDSQSRVFAGWSGKKIIGYLYREQLTWSTVQQWTRHGRLAWPFSFEIFLRRSVDKRRRESKVAFFSASEST